MVGKKTITNIFVIAISLALAVLGGLFAPAWLIAAALALTATTLLPLGVDWVLTPKPFRGLTGIIRQADEKAKLHPLLKQHYDDTIERTEKDLKSILTGRFEFKVSEIPPMSAYAVSLVDERCTLLFPIHTETSEGLFVTDKIGANLYYSQIIETSRTLKEKGKTAVTRIFVLDDEQDEISIDVMSFIQKNIADEINVRMIQKSNMPPNQDGLEWNDFGYYEISDGTSWVMMVRKSGGGIDDFSSDYYVETDPLVVDKYKKYSDAVLANTTDANTFINNLKRPVNAAVWPVYFAQQGYEMAPPHGLSFEDAEIIAQSVAGHESAAEEKNIEVLILGFTPKIIRALDMLGNVNITSIDNISVKPSDQSNKIEYLTINWLDLDEDGKFDAILFDESLNNLSRLQNALFYPILCRALKPGGHLIGRVLGHFDEQVAERYKAKTPDEIIQALKSVDGEKHEDYAPSIMKFLHSRYVSFDNSNSTIDCKRWNHFLKENLAARKISQKEAELWQINFEIEIFVPDLDFLIVNAEAAGFTPCEIRKSKGEYLNENTELGEFYRIINLERTV